MGSFWEGFEKGFRRLRSNMIYDLEDLVLKVLAKIQIFGTVFIDSMSFQYTYDAEGKPVGVFVPLNEWEKITDALKKVRDKKRKTPSQKTQVSKILKGLKQVDQIEKGEIKSISIKKLLNEL